MKNWNWLDLVRNIDNFLPGVFYSELSPTIRHKRVQCCQWNRFKEWQKLTNTRFYFIDNLYLYYDIETVTYTHSFKSRAQFFSEPQLCLLNHKHQPYYMLMLCIYKYFMSTFMEWLKENSLLCLHCDILCRMFTVPLHLSIAFFVHSCVVSRGSMRP